MLYTPTPPIIRIRFLLLISRILSLLLNFIFRYLHLEEKKYTKYIYV